MNNPPRLQNSDPIILGAQCYQPPEPASQLRSFEFSAFTREGAAKPVVARIPEGMSQRVTAEAQ